MNNPPITMREAAVMMHEWYSSLVVAGFTEEQALEMVIAQMLNADPTSE